MYIIFTQGEIRENLKGEGGGLWMKERGGRGGGGKL